MLELGWEGVSGVLGLGWEGVDALGNGIDEEYWGSGGWKGLAMLTWVLSEREVVGERERENTWEKENRSPLLAYEQVICRFLN